MEQHLHNWCPIEERDEGIDSFLFERLMAENFSYLGKETDIQIQKAHRVPNKINQRDPHQHILKLKLSL